VAEAHRTPGFRNAVEYTIAVTVTVQGGARHGTADRRARLIAERLANTAARSADVVEVTAKAGHSHNGELSSPRPVRFAAANTGTVVYGAPDKLDRYLDPDHERALYSLGSANDAYRARQRADRDRRQEVSCRNTYASLLQRDPCVCVYCAPARHYDSLEAQRQHPDNEFVDHYCPCGQDVAKAGDRCQRHLPARIVALEGDDILLQRLADGQRDRDRTQETDGRPPKRRQPPGHGLDL
jgi:hypothetical protein